MLYIYTMTCASEVPREVQSLLALRKHCTANVGPIADLAFFYTALHVYGRCLQSSVGLHLEFCFEKAVDGNAACLFLLKPLNSI